MSLLAVGLSHRTAPTDLLEQVSAGIGDCVKLLHQLAGAEHVAEAVVLSTCNRVEVYTHVTAFHGGHVDVTDALSGVAGVSVEELSPHLYVDYDARAVQHLFQVVCGLDSMLVGEAQIVGQARAAYKQAEVEGTLGRVLGEAFRHALRVGKKVRSDTAIDRAGASLVSIAVAQAEEIVGSLHGRTVGVVGAGATGSLAATTLQRAGAGTIIVANRGADSGRRLAERMQGESIDFADLTSLLVRSDVVSSATASVSNVITVADVEAALPGRAGRPLVLLDLGLPRDVDPRVRELPGVSVIDLEDLGAALAHQPAQRDVEAAAAIVAEEVTAFSGWQRAIRVAPTVIALRTKAETVVRGELERLLGRLPDLDDHSRHEVEDTVRRVVEKLIHAPTVRVKELANDPGGDAYADALRELFELPRVLPEALAQPAPTDGEAGVVS
jgi:glutamyl-tRNA reductase